MKNIIFFSSVSLLLFALVLNSCEVRKEKMPITASSEEAMKEYLEGRNLTENLRGQESLPYFKKAIELDEKFAMAYIGYAFNYPAAKGFFENLNKAVALVDKVSEGEKTYILGVDAGVSGKPKAQQKYFEKLVEMYPDDERAHNFLGNNYFGQQLFDEAIAEFNKAVEINPNYAAPYNSLGYAYRPLEKYDEAEKAFKRYIELIPDDPNPYDSYAELMLKMGEFDKSITNYEKALEKDNNFVASYLGIASNLNYLGDYETARNKISELLSVARNDGERRAAYNAMAVSYTDEGNLDKALENINLQYELAKKINDKAAMSGDLALMGNIYFEMGKSKEALEHYNNSVQMADATDMSPELKENIRLGHFYSTASCAMLNADFETAKKDCEEFMKGVKAINNPNQIRLAHQLRGMILMKEENYADAEKELIQANLQNPYNLYRLAVVYNKLNNSEMAKEYCEKAAKFNPVANFQYAFIRNKANAMLTEL